MAARQLKCGRRALSALYGGLADGCGESFRRMNAGSFASEKPGCMYPISEACMGEGRLPFKMDWGCGNFK